MNLRNSKDSKDLLRCTVDSEPAVLVHRKADRVEVLPGFEPDDERGVDLKGLPKDQQQGLLQESTAGTLK